MALIDPNECSCKTGQPINGFVLTENPDGTVSLDLTIQNGDGDPECDVLATLAMRDESSLIFGVEYNYGDDASSPNSFGVSGGETGWNNNYAPYFTGSFVDGGTIIFDLPSYTLLNGCDGALSFDFNFEHPRCGVCEPSNIRQTITFEPPVSQLTNHVCVGGVSGVIQFDQVLQDYNGAPLVAGDPVKYTFKNDTDGVLEVIDGVYGDLLSGFTSTFTNPLIVSSFKNWLSGNATDGSTIDFARIDWQNANGFTYANGTPTTNGWISGVKKVTSCIETYDASECSWNDNTDTSIEIERFVDLIEGSIFWQQPTNNILSVYHMRDNGLFYNNPNSFEIKTNNVVTDNTVPAFVSTTFGWGTRSLFTYGVRPNNSIIETSISYDNGMTAFNKGFRSALNVGTTEKEYQYNRDPNCNPIGDSYNLVCESVAPLTVNRYLYLSDYNGDNITDPSTVYVDGLFLSNYPHPKNAVNCINDGGLRRSTDIIAIPFTNIGQRVKVRAEQLSSGEEAINEFDIELNYV